VTVIAMIFWIAFWRLWAGQENNRRLLLEADDLHRAEI
jgi:hypothetical protein